MFTAAFRLTWQKGAISRETMFDLFRRGEVLPAGRTDEEEARLTARSPKGEIRVQSRMAWMGADDRQA